METPMSHQNPIDPEKSAQAFAKLILPGSCIDWNGKVDRENGVVKFEQNGKEVEFVKLEELLRLGRERGIKSRTVKIVDVTYTPEGLSAVATAEVEFRDGEISSSAADCGPHNAPEGVYGKYPTALAESRALARALRFGLGIQMCSIEEVNISDIKGGVTKSQDGKITASQKKVIMTIIDRNNLKLSEVLALGKATDIEALTYESASKLIQGLNSGKIVELLNKKG